MTYWLAVAAGWALCMITLARWGVEPWMAVVGGIVVGAIAARS